MLHYDLIHPPPPAALGAEAPLEAVERFACHDLARTPATGASRSPSPPHPRKDR